jgi:hypothetical protein
LFLQADQAELVMLLKVEAVVAVQELRATGAMELMLLLELRAQVEVLLVVREVMTLVEQTEMLQGLVAVGPVTMPITQVETVVTDKLQLHTTYQQLPELIIVGKQVIGMQLQLGRLQVIQVVLPQAFLFPLRLMLCA